MISNSQSNNNHQNQKLSRHTSSAIELQGVQVRYSNNSPLVLDIETLTINQGERVALIGPSGAAKTTLLRLVNGYVRPETGQITVLGQNINRSIAGRRQVGFIFQDFNLIERATVFQNVLWGRLGRVNTLRSLFGWFPKADKRLAMQAIAEVDLVEQAGQRADTLSGGQQQRVAVARVLAQEAKIILADEPVSNLDPTLADDVLGLLVKVAQHHGATLLMSVHQPVLAQRYAQRIIGLRQGCVVFDGRSSDLNNSVLHTIYGREVKHGSETTINQNNRHFNLNHRQQFSSRTEQEVNL
jgi:phosphonate transport system ATP-binding protein